MLSDCFRNCHLVAGEKEHKNGVCLLTSRTDNSSICAVWIMSDTTTKHPIESALCPAPHTEMVKFCLANMCWISLRLLMLIHYIFYTIFCMGVREWCMCGCESVFRKLVPLGFPNYIFLQYVMVQ